MSRKNFNHSITIRINNRRCSKLLYWKVKNYWKKLKDLKKEENILLMNQFSSNWTTDSMQCNHYPSRNFSRNWQANSKFTWNARAVKEILRNNHRANELLSQTLRLIILQWFRGCGQTAYWLNRTESANRTTGALSTPIPEELAFQ